MVEALHIHSIAFDITDKMGLGKDIGLVITLLMFLILITLIYAYILSGNKPCLALYTGLGLFATLLLHIGAVRVNLNNTPEVTQITHLLLFAVFLFRFQLIVQLILWKISMSTFLQWYMTLYNTILNLKNGNFS